MTWQLILFIIVAQPALCWLAKQLAPPPNDWDW